MPKKSIINKSAYDNHSDRMNLEEKINIVKNNNSILGRIRFNTTGTPVKGSIRKDTCHNNRQWTIWKRLHRKCQKLHKKAWNKP